MKYWRVVFMALACQAQQELPPETLLLAKIKAKVAEYLSRLPNFTCTETKKHQRRRRAFWRTPLAYWRKAGLYSTQGRIVYTS